MPEVKNEPAAAGSKFDRVVRAVLEIRDKRKEIADLFKEALAIEDGPLAEKEEKLRLWLHKHLLESGANSLGTDAGTVYFSEIQKVTVEDWPAFYEVIRETGDLELLERRASKSNVVEYIKANGGELPRGVQMSVDRNLNVRAKPSK